MLLSAVTAVASSQGCRGTQNQGILVACSEVKWDIPEGAHSH